MVIVMAVAAQAKGGLDTLLLGDENGPEWMLS